MVMNLKPHACAMLMTDKLFFLLYHTQCYNGHESIKHIIAVIKSHGIIHCVVHLFYDTILPDYLN